MATLGLPPLNLGRAVEALLLPCSIAGFSDQWLKALGDAFLKRAASIHMFNELPTKYEDQF